MENFLTNKRVLVTGGTGFLGKHLCDELMKNVAYLKIIDFRNILGGFGYPDNKFEFIIADIRDKEGLSKACRNIDIVFHCAAIPSIARAKKETYYQINVQGTRNVLEACLENNVNKVVYVSSSTPYGVPKEFPLTEQSPSNPVGKYGESKVEAENVCWEFVKKGLSISIIRPRVIMGAGRIGIFGILFDRVIKNKPLYCLGKGNNVFQFTAVKDMVSACVKAAGFDKSELFNIGSDDNHTVREVLQDLIDHAGSKSKIISFPAWLVRFSLKIISPLGISPLMNEQYLIADKNFKLDTAKAKRILGWHPSQTNSECLIEAFDWYKNNMGVLPQQYKGILGVFGKFKHSQQGGFQKSYE